MKESRDGCLREIRLNQKIVTYVKCQLKNLNESNYVFVWIITLPAIPCIKIHLISYLIVL